MSGISQLVDSRIEQIRKERAELDELRASLERKEAELFSKAQEHQNDLEPLTDRKAILLQEIEAAEAELERLRTEKYASIENFGEAMDELHAEKTADSHAQTRQLQNEIAFLMKGKVEMEEALTLMGQEKVELEEKLSRDQHRIIEEKDVFLARTRAEREASLKEINLQHSVAMADLDKEKKAIQDEIDAMEQTKTIEWNKIQAEISRYKTAQLAELDAQREQFLAEAEKEKSSVLGALRTEERRQLGEISRQKREFDQEMLKLHTQKQNIQDEIKLLEYEYERARSENIVKIEKARIDDHKTLEVERAEALAKIEDEQSALATDWRKQTAELRNRHREEMSIIEKELSAQESKKAALLRDIDQLSVTFEQVRAKNEVELETFRSEKLKEIDTQRLAKLTEVEDIRQERIAALEQNFLEKSSALETIRAEKLEACRQAIIEAEKVLDDVKQQRFSMEQEISILRTEGNKLREENKALEKDLLLERQIKLEKLTNDKLAEVEQICASRLQHAETLMKRMNNEANETEVRIAKEKSEAEKYLSEVRRQISTLESDLGRQKDEQLAKTQEDTIKALDELSKLKLAKLSEIELYLETYKQERLANIQNDLDQKTKDKAKNE
ncbi:MAG: hypothetical protein FWE05_05165 [Defluviitaleaceae bacterium]|nr:hypothetical protein [Defluviitaleaceae bacterium]